MRVKMRIPEKVRSSEFFYKIPGYSNYGISIIGEVFNFARNRQLKGSVNPDGYVNFRLGSDFGYVLTWGLHRLLMYVFNYPGDHYKDLVVNHKNGIKNDNGLNNLEWITYQENQFHAGLNGLTKKCLPVETRCSFTGDTQFFPSATACGQFFDLTKDTILWRLRYGEKRIFPEGRQYRVYQPNKEWYIPTSHEQALVEKFGLENSTGRGKASKKILLRKILVDQVFSFNSITDLSVYIKVPLSTISTWLKNKTQPLLPGYIQIKYATDLSEWRKIENPEKELGQFYRTRRVEVKNNIDNSVIVYKSLTDCSKELNINLTTLHQRLKHGSLKTFKNMVFQYLD